MDQHRTLQSYHNMLWSLCIEYVSISALYVLISSDPYFTNYKLCILLFRLMLSVFSAPDSARTSIRSPCICMHTLLVHQCTMHTEHYFKTEGRRENKNGKMYYFYANDRYWVYSEVCNAPNCIIVIINIPIQNIHTLSVYVHCAALHNVHNPIQHYVYVFCPLLTDAFN